MTRIRTREDAPVMPPNKRMLLTGATRRPQMRRAFGGHRAEASRRP